VKVDFLIVGLGISGALLSRDLLREGKSVLIIDRFDPSSASQVAGGIINPVTGKRLVRSWMIEQLLPFALQTYRQIEAELAVPLITECTILDFFPTVDMRSAFIDKIPEEREFLNEGTRQDSWTEYFRFNYGIGEIDPCLLVDLRTMLHTFRKQMTNSGLLADEVFLWEDCTIASDGVKWKGVTARKVISCDGAAGAANPYFDKLPWSQDKGEAIIAAIPGLPRHHIFKQGTISIVPWQDNLFWIGATHNWKFTDLHPSHIFRKQVEEQLDYLLKIPYTIVDHIVAQRPANFDRRPFIGLHPLHPAIGICNGMGGKGCSMAPYFAQQLAQHLTNGVPILPEADVNRFAGILKR
jgi:glycine/D-amino acid oxidase-like deaminating enzyme